MFYYFDAARSVDKVGRIFSFFQTILKKNKCEMDGEQILNSN